MRKELSEMMKKRKISQTELAYHAGVSQRYIAFLLQGTRSPSLDVALKIADTLKCNVSDIFLPKNCTKCTQGKGKKAVKA